jgi:hypothetical protein
MAKSRMGWARGAFTLLGFAGCDAGPAEADALGLVLAPPAIVPMGQLPPDGELLGVFAPGRRAFAWTWLANAGDTIEAESGGLSPLWPSTVLRLEDGLPAYPSDTPRARGAPCAEDPATTCLRFTAARSGDYALVIHRADLRGEGDFAMVFACRSPQGAPCAPPSESGVP